MIHRFLSVFLIGSLAFMPALSTPAFGQEGAASADMVETFRQQLETDRERLFGMSREARHQYLARYFYDGTREERRAFKMALETVRQEWNFQEPKPEAVEPSRGAAAAKVAGSNITYDTGTVFGGGGTASQMLGNRFDTALDTGGNCCAAVESSGSITMITFDMILTFFGSVVWSLYSDVSGTMAMQVTSMARPGIMTGLNTLAVMSPTTANVYSNGTFLAGIWQFAPTMTGLAIDTGTTGGQGFHGISLNDGAVGTGLTTVTTGGMGVNAIFRVSGDVATPVELMDFTIEKGEN